MLEIVYCVFLFTGFWSDHIDSGIHFHFDKTGHLQQYATPYDWVYCVQSWVATGVCLTNNNIFIIFIVLY